jgi:branched-chain amino acid transport system substrate-binding protein
MSKLASANSLKPRCATCAIAPRFAIALAFTTLATGFLTAACTGGTGGTAANGNTVKIVSSLPMTGSAVGQNQTIVNGIKQAIDEANSTACDGKIKINFESYDDATAAQGKWDPAQVTSNANKAVSDKSVVAVIGHFNSGAAKLSIPILNKDNLVMVSPANTYPGLTKPGKGEANEPNVYYPNGKRNYARVVPADDLQGVAAANWAKSLGSKKSIFWMIKSFMAKGWQPSSMPAPKSRGYKFWDKKELTPKPATIKR